MTPTSFALEPVRWLKAISDFGGTTAAAPNFAFDHCASVVTAEQKAELNLGSLRVLFNGAETIRGETLDRFVTAFGACGFRASAFFPCYGIAEATLFVSGGPRGTGPKRLWVDAAALAAGHVDISRNDGPNARCVVSCGLPATGTDIEIIDPGTCRTARPGHIGEVYVRSDSVAAGYWDRPEDSRDAFGHQLGDTGKGPYLATGDLGFLDAGELYITGRIKDVIIIRGRTIYPQDVEEVVRQVVEFVPVNGCAAFTGWEGSDERLGVVVESDRAFVRRVRQEFGAWGELVAAVRAAIAREFDIAVNELAVVKPGTFPRTSSGKVRRRACRDGLRSDTLDFIVRWRAGGDPDEAVHYEK